jgi:hypothetical protein
VHHEIGPWDALRLSHSCAVAAPGINGVSHHRLRKVCRRILDRASVAFPDWHRSPGCGRAGANRRVFLHPWGDWRNPAFASGRGPEPDRSWRPALDCAKLVFPPPGRSNSESNRVASVRVKRLGTHPRYSQSLRCPLIFHFSPPTFSPLHPLGAPFNHFLRFGPFSLRSSANIAKATMA